eukprot:CAMPEP_0204564558 /NCGR_PEP_ID=MMETSP0661-20131031/34957_1 /ASSEMBLY_ACC=CAM_ASM_000606 /TAXON_ID=109239 /ORGANISM="Alexandrium margalefi, Strain AMGDE01CS-322" /LENGTH=296 /DNA_ID=CAMNT_0051572211 /DNA_START=60 /DNA_END=946 /DNA_ORIENTATION=+
MAGRMVLLRTLCAAHLASGAVMLNRAGSRATQHDGDTAADESARTILQEVAGGPQKSIIICNAFAHSRPLDVVNSRSQERLMQEGPLGYKSCREVKTVLKEGDRLDFKLGNASVGIFKATGIPENKASLLLVPHRRYSGSLSAAFESHAFADTGSPQLAIVDAYRGKEESKVMIMDAAAAAAAAAAGDDKQEPKTHRVEQLRFNSVVSLGPGKYQIALQAGGQKDLATSPLEVSTERFAYVVMRTGLQNSFNASAPSEYPQDLVVYGEQRKPPAARSSAAGLRAASSLLLAVVAAA